MHGGQIRRLRVEGVGGQEKMAGLSDARTGGTPIQPQWVFPVAGLEHEG